MCPSEYEDAHNDPDSEPFTDKMSIPDIIRSRQNPGLEKQIELVRNLRATLDARTQEHHELQCEFNLQHKDLIEGLCKSRIECAQAEEELRRLTLAAYEETGSKRPATGVGIRVSKKLQYDENSIKNWAITNGHIMFLALDRAGFEGWAKAMMKRGLPASLAESGAAVNEIETITATIAKEL